MDRNHKLLSINPASCEYIGKLNGVVELPSRVRSWAVDWLEKDNVEEPEWLRNVLWG